MKKFILPIFLAVISLPIMSLNGSNPNEDVEAIKQVLLKGYVHGAFNELDPDAMAETFHEDFAIFSPDGNEISKYPISNWIESTRQRKQDPNFDPQNNIWEPKFVNIDVTGNAASVSLELYHKDKHVYTDYLSMLKFDDGWKVVAKVYHQHR